VYEQVDSLLLYVPYMLETLLIFLGDDYLSANGCKIFQLSYISINAMRLFIYFIYFGFKDRDLWLEILSLSLMKVFL